MGARCQLPPIPQAQLDEAVRESFVRQFVDSVDVQATVERERSRLSRLKSAAADAARDELARVTAEVRSLESLEERARMDYEAGSLAAVLYSKLHDDYQRRLADAQTALGNLESAAAAQELSRDELDTLLDRVLSIKRLIEGHLTETEVPLLNAQLHTVFAEFIIAHEDRRIIVDPKLRPEFVPDGSWRTLDFGSADQEGVEVVEHVGAVMRKVSLTSGFADRKIIGSS